MGEKFTANSRKAETTPGTAASTLVDPSSIMNAALAAQMQTIESLKSEKATLLEAHARELKAKDDLIQSLRDQLEAKDELIVEQKARLIDYRRIINSHTGLPDYPFPIGAAEYSGKPNL
jgi:DNA repair exonuclease SbcCD ATPase subunit